MYLIHVHFVLVYVERHHLGYWPTFLVTLAIALPLSWLLWRLVQPLETKLRNL